MSEIAQYPKTRDFTEGSALRAVFALSLPATATMLVRSTLTIYDMWLLGHKGAEFQAAFTGASFYMWVLFSLVQLVTVGGGALVARFVGAKDPKSLTKTAFTTFFGSMLLAAVAGALLSAFALAGVSLTGMEPETTELASSFLKVIAVGLPAVFGNRTIEAIFYGTGDTKMPFFLLLITIVLHFMLAPMFVFGFGPVPSFGLAGLAISWSLSHLAGMIGGLIVLNKRRVLTLKEGFAFEFKWFGEMVRIGLPLALEGAFFSLIYVGLSRIVVSFGDAGLAALGIGHRIESISFMTAAGFSQATATLVGQNLGANKPDRASRSAWTSLGVITIFTIIVAVLFVVFQDTLAVFFTSDSIVAGYAKDYLVIIALSQTAMGVGIVLEGAFGGAGDTIPPMVIRLPITFLRIPVAYFLALKHNMGVQGVFWAITLMTILSGVLELAWFARGKWKTKLADRLKMKDAMPSRA